MIGSEICFFYAVHIRIVLMTKGYLKAHTANQPTYKMMMDKMGFVMSAE